MKHNNNVSHCFVWIKFVSFIQNRIHQGIEMFFRLISTSFKRFIAVNSSQILTQYGFAKISYRNSMNLRINLTLNSFFSTFLRKNQKFNCL